MGCYGYVMSYYGRPQSAVAAQLALEPIAAVVGRIVVVVVGMAVATGIVAVAHIVALVLAVVGTVVVAMALALVLAVVGTVVVAMALALVVAIVGIAVVALALAFVGQIGAVEHIGASAAVGIGMAFAGVELACIRLGNGPVVVLGRNQLDTSFALNPWNPLLIVDVKLIF
jgi:hypothetical protein